MAPDVDPVIGQGHQQDGEAAGVQGHGTAPDLRNDRKELSKQETGDDERGPEKDQLRRYGSFPLRELRRICLVKQPSMTVTMKFRLDRIQVFERPGPVF